MTARIGDERGFTLIELLIAMALTAVGVAATLGVFGAAGRTTVISQNTEVGAQQAQAELDRLSKLKYGELALTSTPVNSTNVKNPNYRVSGTNFNVRTGLTEALVTTAGDGATAKVDPGPTNFAVGQRRLDDHREDLPLRHVARRELPHHHLRRHREHQARDRRGEPGPGRQHRPARPAVVLHRDQRTRAPRLPATRAPREETGPGQASNTSAQIFYLYDEPCGGRGDARRLTGTSRRPAATTPATRPRSALRRRATRPARTPTR